MNVSRKISTSRLLSFAETCKTENKRTQSRRGHKGSLLAFLASLRENSKTQKLSFVVLFLILASNLQAANVRLGIDELRRDEFRLLKGKRIGLVAHPASVDSQLVSTIDVLRSTDKFKLVALFGPEHGVYADEYAGVKVADRVDPRTGLKIFSLYGNNRKPTREMLKGLDVLMFDLQDIGSRSYTYISTMKLCLEAAAEADIEFMVLDRPNPLGGERIEGPMVEKGFESFISALPVPYLHGMTMGELAIMMKEELVPHYQKLTIVKMAGWRRSMVWSETGLEWVPTSPHIPQASTCAAYAATGILGELGQINIGVGYTRPFELIGAPWIKADVLAATLNLFWRSPPQSYRQISSNSELDIKSTPCPEGLLFRSMRYKPFYALYKDQPCEGVQIHFLSKEVETLTEINFRTLWALDAPKLFKQASKEQIAMFDKACGTDEPRKWLTDRRNMEELFERWKVINQEFREWRQKFLLY